MRSDGLSIPDHLVARYYENEVGDIVPVPCGDEIAITNAKYAILSASAKIGTKWLIVTQYPQNAQATSVAGTSFNGSFLGTSEATEGYELQVSTNNTFTSLVAGYPQVLAAGTGTRTFAVTGLVTNTNYYFRVKSKSTANGDSIWCSIIKVKTASIRSVEFASTNPFLNWNFNEASGTIITDSTGHSRNGTLVGTATYAKTAIDQSEAANKSMGLTGTCHVIYDNFAVQSGQSLGFGFSVDYKGTGTAAARLISLHNTGNGNLQVFAAKPASGIKCRIKIENAAGTTLLDTETTADFFNNVRNNIEVSIVGNAYLVLVNGVLDKSGTFASQASNAFDINRIVVNGFGNTTIGSRNTGDYGRVAVWFGGVPSQTALATLYSIGLWA